MTNSPTLILGGAGTTGRHVAKRLGARGVAFRLASRSSEPRMDGVDRAGLDAAGPFVRQAVGS